MAQLTWNAVSDRDLSTWFAARLKRETREIRDRLFGDDDPIVPPEEPWALALLIEVVGYRAHEMGVPPQPLMKILADALGLATVPVPTPPGGVRSFLDSLRQTAAPTGGAALGGTHAPVEPAQGRTEDGPVPGPIRIVHAQDVVKRVLDTLLELDETKEHFDALSHDEMAHVFVELTGRVRAMIGEGLQ